MQQHSISPKNLLDSELTVGASLLANITNIVARKLAPTKIAISNGQSGLVSENCSFKQTGFTLIEMLVVLIMVAMVSGILFQALDRAYRLQDRFGVELFKAQKKQMVTGWYRQTVQGLYPDFPKGQHLFQGNEIEFSGLTTNALSSEYGAPTPITWKIRRNSSNSTTQLIYLEGKQEDIIFTWQGSDIRFIYIDEKQTLHESWPPPFGLPTQIPKQIQLVVKTGNEVINIVATPMGPIATLPNYQEEL